MRVLVAATQVPFIVGGADLHVNGLKVALLEAGHEVELIRVPFMFSPPAAIQNSMDFCQQLDLSSPNGYKIDKLISLQFPLFGCQHPDHRVWLMHQHRSAYELYDADVATEAETQLRERIHQFDTAALRGVRAVFSNSANVSRRLQHYNGIDSQPLYHPPALESHFYGADAWDYVFFPSRVETLKRQWLLIEAAQYLRSPLRILIAGDGGQLPACREQIERLGLGDRIELMGRISDELKIATYAHALGVFYGPQDEDLGYITLEAMLAAKPVITCRDSGGPLEFVGHQQTGLVVEPEPQAVAAALDELWYDRERARRMGESGLERYRSLQLSWANVVDTLLQD